MSEHEKSASSEEMMNKLKLGTISENELGNLQMIARKLYQTTSLKSEINNGKIGSESNPSSELKKSELEIENLSDNLLSYLEKLETVFENEEKFNKGLSIIMTIITNNPNTFLGKQERLLEIIVKIQKVQRKESIKPVLLHGGLDIIQQVLKTNNDDDSIDVRDVFLRKILKYVDNEKEQLESHQTEFCYCCLDLLFKSENKEELQLNQEREIMSQLGNAIEQGLKSKDAMIRRTCYVILVRLKNMVQKSKNEERLELLNRMVFNKLDKKQVSLMEYLISNPTAL